MADHQIPMEIFGIYDRGVPNLERIVLKVYEPLDLTYYALVLGVKGLGDSIVPFRDNYFWFGNTEMLLPGWLFVYTGVGTPAISKEQHTDEPVQTLYWNKPTVILSNPDIIPAVFRMTDVHIGNQANKSILDLKKTPPQNPALDAMLQEFLKLANNTKDSKTTSSETILRDLLKLSDNSKKA